MDKLKLHSIVLFVDDIAAASSSYAKLMDASVTGDEYFKAIILDDLSVGFHPADEKSRAGSAVLYFVTDDIHETIAQAQDSGFRVYRGPIQKDGEKIVQMTDEAGVRIGFVQKA